MKSEEKARQVERWVPKEKGKSKERCAPSWVRRPKVQAWWVRAVGLVLHEEPETMR